MSPTLNARQAPQQDATLAPGSEPALSAARTELYQACLGMLREKQRLVAEQRSTLEAFLKGSIDRPQASDSASIPPSELDAELLRIAPRAFPRSVHAGTKAPELMQLALNIGTYLKEQGCAPEGLHTYEALLQYTAQALEAPAGRALVERFLLKPSADFFSRILRFSRLHDLVDPKVYTQLSQDSYFVVVDIQGSTKTIEELGPRGYKFVNGAAAAIFQALRNVNPDIRLPAVYGGDGFNVAVPASAIQRTMQALYEAQQMVKACSSFGNLNLRAGAVPYHEILARGGRIYVAEQVLTESSVLPRPVSVGAFSGTGIAIAEQLVKREGRFPLTADENVKTADLFKGYECRWSRIPSCDRQHQWLSVVIEPRNESPALLRELLESIAQALPGFGTKLPFSQRQLKLSLSPRELEVETQIQAYDKNWIGKLQYKASILLGTLAGRIMSFKNQHFGGPRWKAANYDPAVYDPQVASKVDWCKRDGDIKFVWDCSAAEREALTAVLSRFYQQGKIFWGSALSSHVNINCLVVDRNRGDDTHLIDGNLTGAAKAKKLQKTLVSGR